MSGKRPRLKVPGSGGAAATGEKCDFSKAGSGLCAPCPASDKAPPCERRLRGDVIITNVFKQHCHQSEACAGLVPGGDGSVNTKSDQTAHTTPTHSMFKERAKQTTPLDTAKHPRGTWEFLMTLETKADDAPLHVCAFRPSRQKRPKPTAEGKQCPPAAAKSTNPDDAAVKSTAASRETTTLESTKEGKCSCQADYPEWFLKQHAGEIQCPWALQIPIKLNDNHSSEEETQVGTAMDASAYIATHSAKRGRPHEGHAASTHRADVQQLMPLLGSNSNAPPRRPDTHFLIDTGAAEHITPNKRILSDTKPARLTFMGVGGKEITCRTKGKLGQHLDHVYEIENCPWGLVSVVKLLQTWRGSGILFTLKGVFRTNGAHTVSAKQPKIGRVLGNKFVADHSYFGINAVPEALLLCPVGARGAILWHRRLGHPSNARLRKLINTPGTTVPLKIADIKHLENTFCQACAYGKAKKTPFPKKARHRAHFPGGRVCVDTHGPLVKRSLLGGAVYFTVFVDDCTRRSWVYLHKRRTGPVLIKIFMRFLLEFSRETGLQAQCFDLEWRTQVADQRAVRAIRSDNAGEFWGGEVGAWLKQQTIKHERTVAYSSEQNGVAERRIRTLNDVARCNLAHAGRSISYWAWAVYAANFQVNRLPTSANRGIAPMHRWSGEAPDTSMLRTWGCTCYVHLPPKKRARAERMDLSPAAKMGVFVGYSRHSKGWLVYIPESRTLLTCRSVIFDETSVGGSTSPKTSDDMATLLKHLDVWTNDGVQRTMSQDPSAADVPGGQPSGGSGQEPAQDEVNGPVTNEGEEMTAAPAPVELIGDSNADPERRDEPPTDSPQHNGEVLDQEEGSIITRADVEEAEEETSTSPPHLRPRGALGKVRTSTDDTHVPSVGDHVYKTFEDGEEYKGYIYDMNTDLETGELLYGVLYEDADKEDYTLEQIRELRRQHALKEEARSNAQKQISQEEFAGAVRTLCQDSPAFALTVGAVQKETQAVRLLYGLAEKLPPRLSSRSTPSATQSRMARDVAIPLSAKFALSGADGPHWKGAIDKELDQMEKFKVWELIPRAKAYKRPISMTWAFKCKSNADGTIERFKARLCARGFLQRFGVDYSATYAPVARLITIRILITLAAISGFTIKHLDFESAFLQGRLAEEVFVEIPFGMDAPGMVIRLLKSIYGLKQAGRVWFDLLISGLTGIGFTQSHSDPCFLYIIGKVGAIYIAVWVDDCIVVYSNHQQWKHIEAKISKQFRVGSTTDFSWCLGMAVKRLSNGAIRLHQELYVETLVDTFKMEKAHPVSVPLSPSTILCKDGVHGQEKPSEYVGEHIHALYRSLLGGLLHLSNFTRPDIAYAVGVCAKYTNYPRMAHWKALKGVLKYLKGTKGMGLVYGVNQNQNKVAYSYVGTPKPAVLSCVDANWARDVDDRKSTSAFVFLFWGCVVSWYCRKQSVVALSTAEAEYYAASEATKEAIWVSRLLKEIGTLTGCIPLLDDSQACIKMVERKTTSNKTKHVDIKAHFIRHHFAKGDIRMVNVPTGDQLADIMTKGLPLVKFKVFRDALVA